MVFLLVVVVVKEAGHVEGPFCSRVTVWNVSSYESCGWLHQLETMVSLSVAFCFRSLFFPSLFLNFLPLRNIFSFLLCCVFIVKVKCYLNQPT